MDFTNAYFVGTQPYHPRQFIGISPLTPSHSNSTSDDYRMTSPTDGFADFPPEHFQGYEAYAQFSSHQDVLPGPPTPPDQQQVLPRPMVQTHQSVQQTNSSRPPPNVLSDTTSSNTSIDIVSSITVEHHPCTEVISYTKIEPDIEDLSLHQNQQQEQARRGGSNSDDDDLTPAQSRRKAQNRAAQRAFRERKERHVKELEAKLATLQAAQQKTATENEQLRQDLQKVNTENEILRATSTLKAVTMTVGGPHASRASGPMTTGPMTYNPTDFYTDLLADHDNKSPSHRIATSNRGERLLAAGATWDLIISHDLFRRGLVDVADISNRLKHQAKCDGQGPVFEERAILIAIKQSVGTGSDSLL